MHLLVVGQEVGREGVAEGIAQHQRPPTGVCAGDDLSPGQAGVVHEAAVGGGAVVHQVDLTELVGVAHHQALGGQQRIEHVEGVVVAAVCGVAGDDGLVVVLLVGNHRHAQGLEHLRAHDVRALGGPVVVGVVEHGGIAGDVGLKDVVGAEHVDALGALQAVLQHHLHAAAPAAELVLLVHPAVGHRGQRHLGEADRAVLRQVALHDAQGVGVGGDLVLVVGVVLQQRSVGLFIVQVAVRVGDGDLAVVGQDLALLARVLLLGCVAARRDCAHLRDAGDRSGIGGGCRAVLLCALHLQVAGLQLALHLRGLLRQRVVGGEHGEAVQQAVGKGHHAVAREEVVRQEGVELRGKFIVEQGLGREPGEALHHAVFCLGDVILLLGGAHQKDSGDGAGEHPPDRHLE